VHSTNGRRDGRAVSTAGRGPGGSGPGAEPVRVDEEELDFEYDMAVYEGEPFTGEAVESTTATEGRSR